ncbi:MAG: T9SS type A sorting domain-containing protein [Fimbriimonadaceae bacterium]|nr:T9SS type A sorting domain-containing protein [Chitinophagales bacterium]
MFNFTNDTTPEFEINFYYDSFSGGGTTYGNQADGYKMMASFKSLSENIEIARFQNIYGQHEYAYGFDYLDTINIHYSDMVWDNILGDSVVLYDRIIIVYGSDGGFWNDTLPHYLAFRSVNETDTSYGWMNISVFFYYLTPSNFQIRDLAYQGEIYDISFSDKCYLEPEVFELNHIFPNPAGNEITVVTEDNFYNGIISIYTINGRLMRTEKFDFSILDISDFQKGVYFVKLQLGKEIQTMKFVKI